MKHLVVLIFSFILFIGASCKIKPKQEQAELTKETIFPETLITQLDSSLNEDSGIIYWNNLIWTFNDSGGKNQVYGCDPLSGKIKITLQFLNAWNTDWEDIAQDEKNIYIAETGNNFGGRKDLQIYILRKNDVTDQAYQEVNVDRIAYRYADQIHFGKGLKKHNFDCEALFAFNDSLYIFTKDWVDFKTRAYAMPAIPGDYILLPVDSFDVKGLITGADINESGKIALMGYQDYRSFAWTFQKTGKHLFNQPQYINLSMLVNAQTEGICFDPKGDLLFSCEKTDSYPQMVWVIPAGKY